MVESEEDSDMDTGFYSDGEEAAPAKRKSLLVALRCVCLCVKVIMIPFILNFETILVLRNYILNH